MASLGALILAAWTGSAPLVGARPIDDDDDGPARAQINRSPREPIIRCLHSRRRRCLAVPSYRGDPSIGHQFGLRGRYVLREAGAAVNRVQIDVATRLSTKLIQNHELQLRLRELWGHGEILQSRLAYIDDPIYPFFGVARGERLSSEELNDPKYKLHLRSMGLQVDLQPEIVRFDRVLANRHDPPATLHSIAGLRWAVDSIDAEPQSHVAVERPEDIGVRYRGSVIVGASWDRRDNEWAPTLGGQHDVTAEFARPWAGASTTFTRINASFRWFRWIGTPRLVLAQRLLYDHVLGDPPLYTLGEFGGLWPIDGLGGRYSARGFARQRIIGAHKMASSTELRLDLFGFHLGARHIGVGTKAFADVGKAAVPRQRWRKNLRHSIGGGIYVVWDRFFVVRLDVGASNEDVQWYVSSGHMF
ncbi:MAG: hypothetical protein B7733_13330 [Myxococcales bacterium FL481]|nr:MAG: hypothetical protein B7733_13330 [Myxococcales bacterium FL481]